ncbi:MAG: hypothetical protein LBM41_02630 [Ruminococcus sp.]|jgi:hypothetical protein|nr:hypothetical protein [Ruminococcus sp.]
MSLFEIFALIYFITIAVWVIITLFNILRLKDAVPLASLPVVIAVPVFGFIYAVIARYSKPKNIDLFELNTPYEISEISKHIAEDKMTGITVIPFEESLVVNEASTRHEMILQVIRKNSADNVPLLSGARKSTDTEIAHYASATLMKLQSTFEKKIRNALDRFYEKPDDLFTINRAVDALRSYIESKLLHGYMMNEQRLTLKKILDKKLILMPESKSTYIYAAQNAIELEDFDYAEDIIVRFCNLFETDERGVFLRLEKHLAMSDTEGYKRSVAELADSNINLTARGRELLRFLEADISEGGSSENRFEELITL